MADKFAPEISETVQIFKDKSPKPSFLSPEQIKVYTQLIKDNPIGFDANINLLKEKFPEDFAGINPLTELELESLDKNAFSSLLDRNKSYKEMAKLFPLEPLSATTGDIIIPVPDSGVPAALGYSMQSKIPFDLGIIRNHYVGRTFIEPSQQIRSLGVKLKLNANKSAIKDKKIILVDDSLVRGTTSHKIVKMLYDAGAKEVHVRIASPEIRYCLLYTSDAADE